MKYIIPAIGLALLPAQSKAEPIAIAAGAVIGGIVLNEMVSDMKSCEVKTTKQITVDGVTYYQDGCVQFEKSPFYGKKKDSK